jgi:hypothetical protein
MQPIVLDNNVVGYTLFVHPSFSHITNGFRIPHDFAQPGDLIAILLPWTLSPEQLENRVGSQNKDLSFSPLPTIDDKRWTHFLRSNPTYHHALRILHFPKELYEFISQREGLPYCIWAEVQPGSRRISLEAKLLDDILKHTKSRKVPEGSNCRIVFVHLGALKTLNRFPALAMKRAQHHQTTFYTFGTQEGTAPQFWRMEEIYPCGKWVYTYFHF